MKDGYLQHNLQENIGYNQGLIDMCCKGKRNKHKNYICKYE